MDTSAAVPAGYYRFDPVHTFAVFSVRHLLVGRVDGRFNTLEGGFLVIDDADRPFDEVDVRIDVASVDTKVERRDEDLRGSRFFEVERFPAMTFQGGATGRRDAGGWAVAGELTIRAIARTVTCDVIVRGATTDPRGHTRIGATATTALTRRDFGLTTELQQESGDGTGPDVEVRLDIEAVLEPG